VNASPPPKPPRSLKARALQWLAQREQSRSELRRKLLRHALADAEGQAAQAGDHTGTGAGTGTDAEARVDALLDWLEAGRYLSPERFIESRVHARAARYGNLRIRQEMQQHDLALDAGTAAALAGSELDRARAVHARRFPAPPQDAAERARRARFLIGRGFSPEVVRRIVREAADAGSEQIIGV
jgi:regulatory protein